MALPQDHRLALVGKADRPYGGRGNLCPGEGFGRDRLLVLPDLPRVLLHKAGCRKAGDEGTLCGTPTDQIRPIHPGPCAGGSLVERKDEIHAGIIGC